MTEPAAGGRKKKVRADNWTRTGVVVLGVGLLLCCCAPISYVSLVLVPLGVAALTVRTFREERKFAQIRTPLRKVLIGAVAVGAILLPLGLGGFAIRHFDRGDYVRIYGTRVQATVDTTKCNWINLGRRGNSDTMGCHGVTWTVDGRTLTGSMEIKGEDHPAVEDTPDVVQVNGYALGDAAVTDRSISGNKVGLIGAIPIWVPGISVLLLAAGFVGRDRLTKRLNGSGT